MLLRSLPLIALMAMAISSKAQSSEFIFFETEAPVDRSQLKFIIQAVLDVDPGAGVFHSDDLSILQVKPSNGLSEQAYREAIGQAGITLRPGTRTAEELGLNQTPTDGPPVYIATGNDAVDMPRYQAAVEQWNAAHPDQPLSPTPVHNRQ